MDSAFETVPFYEQSDENNRSMAEVAPQPGEDEKAFTARANEELLEQYPDSSKDDRKKMARKIIDVQNWQMDPMSDEKQRGHEAITDEGYREKIVGIREKYKASNNAIKVLRSEGILTNEEAQEKQYENRARYLDSRRSAFDQYDREYHKKTEVDLPTVEDVDRFRKQEMEELNKQHEEMVNYEARRLGVDSLLDSGLVSRLARGEFSSEVSGDDLEETVKNGLEDGGEVLNINETERFIHRLWQPELKVIKRNSVMRAIAEPVRSKNVIDEDGTSYDESRFILPINNQEFVGYVRENLNDEDDLLAMCAGLSRVLEYGTRNEAIERAQWFYDLVDDASDLDTDSILSMVEALSIKFGTRGDRKWNERFNEFVEKIVWDRGKKEETNEEIDYEDEDRNNAIQLRDDLLKRLAELNIKYKHIGNPRNKNRERASKDGEASNSRVDEIIRLAREIVNLYRNLQHIEGTQQIIDSINDDVDFSGLGVVVHEPTYLDGAWATDRCRVSAFRVESPLSVGEIWCFICEGTLSTEQNIYYGTAKSLEDIEKLFKGDYYRRSDKSPNIKDMGISRIRHGWMTKNMRENMKRGWKSTDIDRLASEDAYEKIASYFYDIINDSRDPKPIVLPKKMDSTEEVANAVGTADNEEVIIEESEPQTGEENITVDNERVESKAKAQMSDKELFKEIQEDDFLNKRTRVWIKDRNNNLKELSRTPRKILEQVMSESELRRLAQILDENGREHPKWFDGE